MTLNKTSILILLLILSACSNPSKKLNGRWKEFYGAGQNTDVKYTDIYLIKVNNEKDISIQCVSETNQIISKILFDSKELTFEITNGSYLLPYKLHFVIDDILEGETITIRGVTKTVKWQRIKEPTN